MNIQQKSGFTLLELMVVVEIIAIVAALAVPGESVAVFYFTGMS